MVALITLVAGLLGNIDTIEALIHNWFPPPATNTVAALPPLGTTFCAYQGHKGSVNTVAWSPNGQYIASGGEDGTVRIWNAMTCKSVTTYQGHKGPVNSISWSPDDTHIVSGSDDTTVQVWLADIGSTDYTYDPSGCGYNLCGNCNEAGRKFKQVLTVTWSPNGKFIAFGTIDGRVSVFDALTGICDFTLNNQMEVRSVAWFPDSKRIVIGEESSPSGSDMYGSMAIQIWNIDDSTTPLVTYKQPDAGMLTLELSPDGKHIISTFTAVNIVVIGKWKISNQSIINDNFLNFGTIDYPSAIAWVCNSRYIVVSLLYGRNEILDSTSWNLIYTYQAVSATAIAWSPDGTRIASASEDGTVRVWQASDKRLC